MRANLSRMWRSGVAMLLALCMVVGVSPVAFATEKPITWENLVNELAPAAVEQAWDYLNEREYVETINGAIEDVKAAVNANYSKYETAITAIADSVVELEDEKAALVEELAGLKAQLEAKKAELDKALADHKIGDIVIPGADLSVENEKHEAAEFECDHENGDCAVINELKAAIEHIEHAIATVENLIADIEGDINAVLELAAKIEAAIEAYGETAESVENAADDLAEAVAAVVAVLTTNVEGTTDAAVAAYEAARAAALEAAEVLEAAVAVAVDLSADIEALLVELTPAIEKLTKLAVEDLAELEALVADPANQEAAIMAALALAKTEVYDKLDADQKAIVDEYAEKIANGEIDLEAVKAQIKEEIETRWPTIEETIKAEYAAAIEALEAKKVELNAELEGYLAELAELGADAAEELVAPIKAQIERVTNDLAVVDADLEAALGHLDAALVEAYNALVAEVEAAYEEAVKSIEQAIADLKAECEAAVQALKDAAEKEIAALVAEAEKQLAALEAAVKEVAELIANVYTAINEEIAAVKAAVEGILDGTIKTVEDLKNALGELGNAAIEALEAAVEELINAVKAAFEAATTADLFVDDTFKYVAIGDGSAEAKGYAEKLNAALVAEGKAEGVKEFAFENYAEAGNTVAAELANLSNVEGADLVTVGFNHVAFLNDAVSGNVELDWAGLIGAENVTYVDELMADIEAEIDAFEVPSALAGIKSLAADWVEAYAYSTVQYAFELPELINEINEVNPDAVVVIVGMYNPLKGVSFKLGENILDVSEYIDYLVTGVAVYGTAYAMLTGNAIYVDAPAVETINGEGVVDMAKLAIKGVSGFIADLYPSAAGDDYIAAELADALDIYYVATGLLGDANGDGKVDTNDAKLILQYAAEIIEAEDLDLSVCDVNGDNKVDTNDAKLILQYAAEIIEKFPVE